MRATSTMVAVVAALSGILLAISPVSAAPVDDSSELSAQSVNASVNTLPCVSGGPSQQDQQNAAALNPQLTNTMRNNMTAYHASCARAVVQAVKDRGLNQRAAAIAMSTVIVESTIRNVDGGDLDSVGLFQQRDSWGSFADRTNPVKATNKFLDVMQQFYPNGSWNTAPIGDVAADVQRPHSSLRYKYGVEANDAVKIADLLWGAPPATAGLRSVVTAGGTQLFGIGADGHVMSTFWSPDITTNGGWHAWFAIPTGYADGTAAPGATVSVTTLNGQTQLFTTAPDGRVISTFWNSGIPTNGGWREWFAIPTGYADGRVGSGSTVSVTTINGQVQLFATAPDRHVISTFWSGSITTNGGWHEWFAIPTGHADGVTAPGSVVTAGGTQLFTTGADGHVMSTFWSPNVTTNGGWHAWFAIPTGYADGTTAAGSTVSVTTINGQAQLFTTAPDRRVMSTFWSASITTNGGWHEWFAIPTGHADGVTAPGSTVTAGGSQLFTVGADGHVMSTFWSPDIPSNGGWHEWFAIPTGFADGNAGRGAAVSVTTINGQPQIFTAAPSGQVISTFWSPRAQFNGGWHEWFAIPTGHADGKVRL
ncbi:PLL family lectin [Lentzea nigeriaca]|uniref:hypothetical protein n=1 Tax=Lentzea nigeriaca TaxID=1128665 RepID=UPI0019563D19|nr:hypothetical protein [Lentzea nigeriaca]MBM7860434.1 hypothetical protein [Lentzea nigeriaca]